VALNAGVIRSAALALLVSQDFRDCKEAGAIKST
jgi:hypothetical protein